MLINSKYVWMLVIIFIAGTFLGQTLAGAFCPDSDLNQDCFVDITDLVIFAEQWLDTEGCAGVKTDNCADLIGDNRIQLGVHLRQEARQGRALLLSRLLRL